MKIKNILPAAVFCALFVCNVYAADVNVSIDGEPVVFADVQPTIVNDRTYVPLRGVFEQLGFDISWDGDTKTATLVKDDIIITASTEELRLNNGRAGKTLATGGVLPLIIGDRLMLPVRSISEASGETVGWNGDTKTVEIYTESNEKSTYENPNGRGTLSEEEYIRSAYALCNEIKEIAAKSDNEALLRFLNKGYVNVREITVITSDNARLKEIADELYALEPASGMASLQPFFKTYADIICEFINITNSCQNGEISAEEALMQLDELRDEKDSMAITFSVALNEYFKAKNVFYEGVYDEYVLDMLK